LACPPDALEPELVELLLFVEPQAPIASAAVSAAAATPSVRVMTLP
jgi:hypothetical protein